MHSRASTFSAMLDSPLRILVVVLALVFAVESAVMIFLPFVVRESLGEAGRTIIDASLLTLICAPLLWWVIIGPLRSIAIQERQRSETIVANAGEAILTIDDDAIIQSCNQATWELFGLRYDQLVNTSLRSFLVDWPRDLSNFSGQHMMQATRAGHCNFPVHVVVSKYPSSIQNIWIVILRDLSIAQEAEKERISMARQTEALRAQQMATLAQIATGVAHEIRNPLTSIKMLIQVNLNTLCDHGFPTQDLKLVEQEIRRMERSINSLLEFARPETPNFRVFAIQEPVKRTQHLIEGKCISQGVQLMVVCPQNEIFVDGDSSQIQQLLLNLCLNSMDAMADGGKLTIHLQQSTYESILTVSDTGPGFDKATQEKLFEPFFTTKPNGVGLGLGICRRIAEAHGGRLCARSKIEGGATFELSLPISKAPLAGGTLSPDLTTLGCTKGVSMSKSNGESPD